MAGGQFDRRSIPLPFAPPIAILGTIAAVISAAAATLVLPGSGVPGAWDVVAAVLPHERAPALGLAIVTLVGAVAWLAAGAVGRRRPLVEAALGGALVAFLLAPAPLDPSPLPFALLGLAYLRLRRRPAANDNDVRPATGFCWVPVARPHDSVAALTSVH